MKVKRSISIFTTAAIMIASAIIISAPSAVSCHISAKAGTPAGKSGGHYKIVIMDPGTANKSSVGHTGPAASGFPLPNYKGETITVALINS